MRVNRGKPNRALKLCCMVLALLMVTSSMLPAMAYGQGEEVVLQEGMNPDTDLPAGGDTNNNTDGNDTNNNTDTNNPDDPEEGPTEGGENPDEDGEGGEGQVTPPAGEQQPGEGDSQQPPVVDGPQDQPMLTTTLEAPLVETVQVTDLSSTKTMFTTHENGGLNLTLTVNGTYSVVADDGADNAKIIVTLTNNELKNYFTGVSRVVLPETVTGGYEVEIAEDGSTIAVSFAVSGGKGSSGNFTVDFDFPAEYTAKVAKDTHIASVSAMALGQSEESLPEDLTIKSTAADSTNFNEIQKSPLGGLTLDTAASITVTHRPCDSNFWRMEPNSEYYIEAHFPDGAVLTLTDIPNFTLISNENGKAVWKANSVANEDGRISAGFHQHVFGLEFPSDEFEAGDTVYQFDLVAKYTLWGETQVREKHMDTALDFTIIPGKVVHVQENVFKTDDKGRVNVSIPEYDNGGSQSYSPVKNDGNAPIPELCFVWENDTGAEGHKASPYRVYVSAKGFGVEFDTLVTVSNGTTSEVVQLTDRKPIGAGSSSSVDISSALNSGPNGSKSPTFAQLGGYYVEKYEIYPVNPATGERELIVGATVGFGTHYRSWQSQKFPNGDDILDQDESHINAYLRWKNESYPEKHTSPAVETKDNVTYTMKAIGHEKASIIEYYGHAPQTCVSLKLEKDTNSTYVPGEEIPMSLAFFNSGAQAATNWHSPELGIILPSAFELKEQPGDTLSLYIGKGTASEKYVGEGILEKKTIDGFEVYVVSFKDPLSVAITAATNKLYSVPLTLIVKDDATPGKYNTNHVGKGDADAIRGHVFGMSGIAWRPRYPDDVETNGNYYKDIHDFNQDGSKEDYFPCGGGSDITVASIQSMIATSEMFNNLLDDGDGDWQDVSNKEAMATVTLAGTGHFRLVIDNAGNNFLGDLQLLNVLPKAGDERSSEWTAGLEDLQVQILDGKGGDKTGDFAYSLQYCTSDTPKYKNDGMEWTGTETFANNAELKTARSFLFKMDSGSRLPPNYTVVITGTIKAPAAATLEEINRPAYNVFTAKANFYTAASGGKGTATQQFTPVKQKFVLLDNQTAKLVKSGFVFKDLNRDGSYDATNDQKYAGITVELYQADPDNNNAPAATALTQTTTDENGMYEFTGLNGGHYYVKVVAPAGDAYSFIQQGSGAGKSHVDAQGLSEMFVLQPSEEKPAPTNAGIQADSALTVEFRKDTAAGDLLKSVTIAHDDQSYASLVLPLDISGTVTAGTAPFTLPALYHIKSGTDSSKAYSLTWDQPTQTLVFVVEAATYTISYQYVDDGSAPYGVAATNGNPVSFTGFDPDKTIVAPEERQDLEFLGWTCEQLNVSNPQETITVPTGTGTNLVVVGHWRSVKFTLSFDTQGGGANPDDQILRVGDKAVEPTPPQKLGHDFIGWFFEKENGGPEWDFDETTMPARDLTLYAQYEAISYTVTFDFNGAPIENIVLTYPFGSLIDRPTDPTWQGHTFINWLYEETHVWDFDEDTMPNHDIVLVAQWEEEIYTVIFLDHDDTELWREQVRWGGSATPPADPTRSGYNFTHWDGNYVNVIQDEIVYARYTPIPTPIETPPEETTEPTPEPTPAPEESSTPSPSQTPAPEETPAPSETPSEEIVPVIENDTSNQTGNPLLDLATGNVPLGGMNQRGAWSLLSLLLSAVALITAIYLIISGFKARNKRSTQEEAEMEATTQDEDEEEQRKNRYSVLRVLAIIIGILTPVVFLLLDDLTTPMVWINRWTPVVLAVFLIHAVTNVLQYLRNRKADELDEEEAQANVEEGAESAAYTD